MPYTFQKHPRTGPCCRQSRARATEGQSSHARGGDPFLLRPAPARRSSRQLRAGSTLPRLEQRTVRLWRLPAGTGSHPWHDDFQVALEVTRRTECFNPTRKDWDTRREEPAYYLCTTTATAQDLGHIIRDHWGIENRLHHVLDTALQEDACRIRRNPGILALIRHFALNLLRHNGKNNIKAALYDNALSLDRLLAYNGI